MLDKIRFPLFLSLEVFQDHLNHKYTQRGAKPLCYFLITYDIKNPQLSYGELSFLHRQYSILTVRALFKLTLIMREKHRALMIRV